MRRKIASVLAWIVATVASILLATAAVGDVGNRVSDRPAPLQSAAGSIVTLLPASSTTVADSAPSTSAAGPSSTAGATVSSITTAAPASSTTITTAPTTQPPTTTRAPVPSTTSTSTTSTTTRPPDDGYLESRQLIGGWVQLRIDGDNVYLEAAVPEPGFSVEVEHNGPESVEVEFTSEAHDSKLHAEFEGGELRVRIEEERED